MLQVSAGIVLSEGKILAMKRGLSKYSYLTGKYEFPGGKIEDDESPKEALIREFSEELKTDIKDIDMKLICVTEYQYPDFPVRLHSFLITTNNFEFTLTEHTEYKWVKPSELCDIDWAEADKDIVKELLEAL